MESRRTGEVREISLMDIRGGAVNERISAELEQILKNILDPNTKAKEKRQLKIQFDFMPAEDRDFIATKITVSAKLASYAPLESTLLVGGDEESPAASEYTKQIPGQMDICGEEEAVPKIIKMPSRAV